METTTPMDDGVKVDMEMSGEMNVPKQQSKSQFNFSSFTQFQKIPSPLEIVQLTRKYIRPWSEFFNTANYKTAASMARLTSRFVRNLSYFQSNYILISMVLMIYSLITAPLILLVLAAAGYASHRIRKAQTPVTLFGYQLTTNDGSKYCFFAHIIFSWRRRHFILDFRRFLFCNIFTCGIL